MLATHRPTGHATGKQVKCAELNLTGRRGSVAVVGGVGVPLLGHDVHGGAVLLDAPDVIPQHVPHRHHQNAVGEASRLSGGLREDKKVSQNLNLNFATLF